MGGRALNLFKLPGRQQSFDHLEIYEAMNRVKNHTVRLEMNNNVMYAYISMGFIANAHNNLIYRICIFILAFKSGTIDNEPKDCVWHGKRLEPFSEKA
jgi:hypothetical protein